MCPDDRCTLTLLTSPFTSTAGGTPVLIARSITPVSCPTVIASPGSDFTAGGTVRPGRARSRARKSKKFSAVIVHREYTRGPWRAVGKILYELRADEVHVIAVAHGRRNYAKLLR